MNKINSLTKKELVDFLSKKFGGQDGKQAKRNISKFNLEEAIYWFAVKYSTGDSKLKQTIKDLEEYAPGPSTGLNQNNYLYQALVEEFVWKPENEGKE